jgi:hypothetical protein
VATLNPAPSLDSSSDGDTTAPDQVASARRGRHRLSAPRSRVAYALGIATVCASIVVDLVGGGPATADPQEQSASVVVADALGIEGSGTDVPEMDDPQLLEQLAASRSERDAEQAAAGASQAQAEQAALAAKAEAEAKAAAEAAAAAEAKAAAAAEAKAAAERAAQAAGAAPGSPAAAAAAAGTTASAVAKINNSAGAVRPQAQAAANAVVSNVPGAAGMTIGGTRASAADPGGHPSGLALDYMCNVALGDAIVAYHIAHWSELGVEYIIWQQRMLSSPGGSWSGMEDRGSPTANHMDHVHVNYR